MRLARRVPARSSRLAGCSGGADEPLRPGPGQDLIACAPAGAATFATDCTAELAADGDDNSSIVRHPDGSFRRFSIVDDGRGIEAADGAQTLDLEFADGKVTVTIGGDRYILPAVHSGDHAAE